MIKDYVKHHSKSKDKIKEITENQWKKLKEANYVTIVMILDSVKILMENFDNPQYTFMLDDFIITALYTHAIEEFGKLIYLKKLTPENNIVKIDYKEKFLCHDYKFQTALDNLPKECRVIQRGDTETIADWITRLNILNTDINEQGDFEYRPLINLFDLFNAISKFRETVNKTDYN